MRRLAFTDLSAFYDDNWQLIPRSQWTDEMGSQAAAMETVVKNAVAGDGKVDTVLKFKVHDKARPLEMLMKHFKLLTDVIELRDDAAMIARLERGRMRHAKFLKDRKRPAK